MKVRSFTILSVYSMCRMQATQNSKFNCSSVPVRRSRSDSSNGKKQLESPKSSPIALFIIYEEYNDFWYTQYTRTCSLKTPPIAIRHDFSCGMRSRGDNSDNDSNNSNNSNNVFMSIPRESGGSRLLDLVKARRGERDARIRRSALSRIGNRDVGWGWKKSKERNKEVFHVWLKLQIRRKHLRKIKCTLLKRRTVNNARE